MAFNITQEWYIRYTTSANTPEFNGGGFDPGVPNAGINYANQDTHVIEITDGATSGSGSVVLTSTTGGISATFVGNTLRLRSGTNFTAGYYVVSAVPNSNTIVLDRGCCTGVGSGGTGRIGGAFGSYLNLAAAGGSLGSPAITSPLTNYGGHTIYVLGDISQGDNPTGTPQYDYDPGYWQIPSGSVTLGPFTHIGVSGRPHFHTSPLMFYNMNNHVFMHMKFTCNAASFPNEGFLGGASNYNSVIDCYFDNGGNDIIGVSLVGDIIGCRFIGTGAAGTFTRSAVRFDNFGSKIVANYIDGWRGTGIYAAASNAGVAIRNIIKRCAFDGIYLDFDTAIYGCLITNNTIDGNLRDGIRLFDIGTLTNSSIHNNIISNNLGYGLNCDFGTSADNLKATRMFIGYNDYYLNTSGSFRNFGPKTGDIFINPEYKNSVSGDYNITSTTLLSTSGWPAYPGSWNYT